MTWGILMDCRQYYSQRLMERDFGRDFVPFPWSTLDDLIQDARFARPIMCPRFPWEWTYKQNEAINPPPAGQYGGHQGQNQQGLGGGGFNGGQNNGGNRAAMERRTDMAMAMAITIGMDLELVITIGIDSATAVEM